MKMKFFTVLLICFIPVFGASAVVDGPDPIILDDVKGGLLSGRNNLCQLMCMVPMGGNISV